VELLISVIALVCSIMAIACCFLLYQVATNHTEKIYKAFVAQNYSSEERGQVLSQMENPKPDRPDNAKARLYQDPNVVNQLHNSLEGQRHKVRP